MRNAFLLRLNSYREPVAGIHRGRLKHIGSGRTSRFSSMERIQDFKVEVLADEELKKSAE